MLGYEKEERGGGEVREEGEMGDVEMFLFFFLSTKTGKGGDKGVWGMGEGIRGGLMGVGETRNLYLMRI